MLLRYVFLKKKNTQNMCKYSRLGRKSVSVAGIKLAIFSMKTPDNSLQFYNYKIYRDGLI